ncbi:helix-turn-helix domain-containing protein [Pedobacter nutrimenti]|uniref:helix-turn-helix domain-containing protein n=1 Tax=Pedobacter nutrimenti TaxID=1241337 RepID=UPI00292CFF00|nr:helix-turn-helix domain-containing protein [Pedobacter nutrimenti]
MRAFVPHPALQPYVQGYNYVGPGVIHQGITSIDIYPADHTEMSFILDEYHAFREKGTTHISGYPLCFVGMLNQGRCFDVFPKTFVQVVFKPYGAFKLFGIPQRHFSNLATDVGLLFPGIDLLTEQLKEASGASAKIVAILEQWLLKRLDMAAKTDVSSIAYACEQIQNSNGLIRIEELCRRMRISTTTLGDQFREKVGFSPKTFSRIVRFNNINTFIGQKRDLKWQELVYVYGFFDQNHFIKEFKHFYGCTPSQWHALKPVE